MSDYIKREDAIQAIVGHLVPKQYDGDLVNAGFEVAHEIVDAVPSADVMPVKHGHWIAVTVSSGRDSWQCSECGRHARGKIENLPYCHCGARMDGEERDNE